MKMATHKSLTPDAILVEWLRDNGVPLNPMASWGTPAHPLRVEKETIDDLEPSGRGLIARKTITQGQPLLVINTKLVLTKQQARETLGADVVTEQMGEYIALALLLVHERAKGPRSFWAPYIDVLPTADEVGQSFLWPEEELALLTGSQALDATRSMQTKLRDEFAELEATLFSARPELFPADDFNLDSFLWAMSMLFSRAVNLREQEMLALVPYADLLNHSPYSATNFMLNTIPFSKEREVTLYADRSYAAGDQVLISYGQKSNSELLLLYGFVVDRNLFDQVELRVALSPEDELYDDKAALLARQALPTEYGFPLLIDRYSSELMQYLRLCVATPTDGPLDSLAYNEPISTANERAAYEVLRKGCEAALASYPETEEEDAAVMSNSALFASLPRRTRMAVRLRRNEKRVLLRTIKVCDEELEQLAKSATAFNRAVPR